MNEIKGGTCEKNQPLEKWLITRCTIRCEHVNSSGSTFSPVKALVSQHQNNGIPVGPPLRGERQLVRVAKQSSIMIIPVALQGVSCIISGLRRAGG